MGTANEVVRMYVNGLPVPALGAYINRPEDQIVITVDSKSAAANAPSFVPIADQVVKAGAPLHIPLEGFDPNSQSLTFTATSSNTNVLTTPIAVAERSLRMDIVEYGQMFFQLFESRVPGITENIIALVQSGVLDDGIFHRVINGFVAQGLDPTGTGFGHPGLLDFDDQYHADLQHTSSGLLSMAKAGDDTNSSQVFITDLNIDASALSETSLRRLDFNHSIFGRLTAGENIRRQIMLVPTNGGNTNRPLQEISIQNVEIVQVGDKSVLMLRAPEGATGTVDVTVTARDAQGNEYAHTFQVTVQPDTYNSPPFFSQTPTNVQTTMNTPVNLPLQVYDDENNQTMIQAERAGLQATILFDNTGDEAGITPVGTTNFSHLGANWSGGTVTNTGASPLASSGTSAYVFGAGGGQVVFDEPLNLAAFYFIHQSGQGPFTATAFDEAGNVLDTKTSNLADQYNDPDNFEAFSALSVPIKRIAFTGGHVDNFEFRARPIQLNFQVNEDTDTVTVTPPTGFVGTMAILVKVAQVSPGTDTVDFFDQQLIRIRVLPAGASAATTPPGDDGDEGDYGDDALDAVFEEIGVV
jgi:cyclophilin family peptidyl-prolyl cis-trans isomerase